MADRKVDVEKFDVRVTKVVTEVVARVLGGRMPGWMADEVALELNAQLFPALNAVIILYEELDCDGDRSRGASGARVPGGECDLPEDGDTSG